MCACPTGEVKDVLMKINVEDDDEFAQALMTWPPVSATAVDGQQYSYLERSHSV